MTVDGLDWDMVLHGVHFRIRVCEYMLVRVGGCGKGLVNRQIKLFY